MLDIFWNGDRVTITNRADISYYGKTGTISKIENTLSGRGITTFVDFPFEEGAWFYPKELVLAFKGPTGDPGM